LQIFREIFNLLVEDLVRRTVVGFVTGLALAPTVGFGQIAPSIPTIDQPTLTWQLRDEKDAMTDAVTHKLVGQTKLTNWLTIKSTADCYPLGVSFTFNASSNEKPTPFAWVGNKIGLRVRIDQKELKIATANKRLDSEADIFFYDAQLTERFFGGVMPMKKNEKSNNMYNSLSSIFNGYTGMRGTIEYGLLSAGKLNDLAIANDIRVELTLAEIGPRVVEIKPQEEPLKTYIGQCISALRAPLEQEAAAKRTQRQLDEVRAKAELEKDRQRIARIEADNVSNRAWLTANAGDTAGARFCRSGQLMHARWHPMGSSINQKDRDKVNVLPPSATHYLSPGAKWIPGGTPVLILGPAIAQTGGLLPYCSVRVSAGGEVVIINVQDLVPN
jgi:hypothetical protein